MQSHQHYLLLSFLFFSLLLLGCSATKITPASDTQADQQDLISKDTLLGDTTESDTTEDTPSEDLVTQDKMPEMDTSSTLCGNAYLDSGETCDDNNNLGGDGCSAYCRTEIGWSCPTPGQRCHPTCGDNQRIAPETCDDGNAFSGDGCTSECQLEAGWRCNDGLCVAASCGDGIVAGFEECEDNDLQPEGGDGCSSTCRLEEGWACNSPGSPCHLSVCGDGIAEGMEQCDDANFNSGDGCTPLCEREPQCTNGICTSECGDGIVLPGEACDDGNQRPGDGCSPICQVEAGFTCTLTPLSEPDSLTLPVILRDFRGCDLAGGHPDFECFIGVDHEIVGDFLSADGKPTYRLGDNGTTPTTTGKAQFRVWYRDVVGVNLASVATLTLNRTGAGTYVYDNPSFFLLDGKGWVASGSEAPRDGGHNFHFTTEVHTWFEYEGDETLTFRGDDDVWVFINRRLALDIGGVHGAEVQSITLNQAEAQRLDLEVGGIYEVAVFQAERHTDGSSYQLTLSDFTTSSTSCVPDCGDGIRAPEEACDDGNTNPGDGCSELCEVEPGYLCDDEGCEPVN